MISFAHTTTAAASPVRADAEIDPTAYALSGSSLHVGIAYRHLRVDLGTFGLVMPRAVHGRPLVLPPGEQLDDVPLLLDENVGRVERVRPTPATLADDRMAARRSERLRHR